MTVPNHDLLCVCSFIMLSHSVNITLPWTLGVFMIRDFMGLSGDRASAQLSGSAEASASLPSPDNLPSATATDDLSLYEGSSLDASDTQEELLLEATEKRQKQEHMVGLRAGILSASFSLSQVCVKTSHMHYRALEYFKSCSHAACVSTVRAWFASAYTPGLVS